MAMVASKPLPPIPSAPISEKGDKEEKSEKSERGERRSHLFSTVANLKRKLELPLAALTTSSSNAQLQPQLQVDLKSSSRNNSCSNILTASTSAATTPGQYPPSRPRSPLPPFASSEETPAAPVSAADVRREVKHNPHYMPLDQRSIQHLRAIARQSIASSYLEPELLWLRLFMEMIQKLAANVSDAWQQIEASYEATSEGQHRGKNEKEESGAPDQVIKREKSRKNTDLAEEQAKGTKGTLKNKPVFTYDILLNKQVGSTHECFFTNGVFEGESILKEERSYGERRRDAPKEDRIRIPLGGTISLVGGPEDLPKAEKILEIIVFALCSLQLEAYLMRDHDVVRPLVVPTGADADLRIAKPPTGLPQPQARSTTLDSSKRVSKGSMFFGWLTRGTVPAKYKKGTTQLAQDVDQKPEHIRAENGSGQSTVASSIAEDLGIGDDLQNVQGSRFGKMIQQIERAIISVSPDIQFPPPHLLLRLREEEILGTDARRKSYTWEDVDFVAKKIGFGNRMGRSSTVSTFQAPRFGTSMPIQAGKGLVKGKANRLPIDSRAGLDHLMTNSNAVQGIFNHQSISFSYSRYWSATAAAPCNPPDMITVEYYRKEGPYEDMGLGEMIEFICKGANAGCSDKTCGHKRLEHISTYTHGEARINITVEQLRPDSSADFASEEFAPFLSSSRKIAAWTRCKMCRSRTKPRMLSKASRLYSFGKYLELLLYGQNFEPGQRPLCEHTKSKDTMARCFLYGGLVVTFEYESIDLFEMRISRLQVQEDFPAMPRFLPSLMDDDDHEYAASTASLSSQMLLPAADSPVSQNSDYITETDRSKLVNKTRLEIMHFYESCKKIIVSMEELLGETRSSSKFSSSKNPLAPHTVQDPAARAALDRLDELGDRWKAEEFSLYDQLRQHPVSRLNDLRNRLQEYIKRTMRSMEMWQKEYCPQALQASTEKHSVAWVLPEYVKSETLHTFPGSCVIVREDEPSSIIACALSSMDYLCLLSSLLSSDEFQPEKNENPPQPPQKDIPHSDSTIRAAPLLRASRSASSVTLARRKSGSRGSEGSTTITGSADGSSLGKYRSASENGDEADDDDDSFLVVDGYQTSVKFLEDSRVDFSSLLPSGSLSARSTIGLHFGSSRHSKNTTLSSMSSAMAEKHHKGSHALPEVSRPMSMMAFPSSTPALVTSPLSTPSESMATNSFFLAPPPDSRSTTPTPSGKPSKHTFGYTALTSGLSGTMKGLSLNALSEKIGSGFSSYGASSAQIEKADKDFFKTEGQERTMRETLLENESMARSPHMKARFSHGNTSFSCTIYYAAEFDTLRRRCGIHQNYVRSLSRCKSWNANGGKSKSSFYKTRDDRFVVKQMVSSWNIAEKDELLKFAPKYFDYMERTRDAPTVLAKIFGFYTFKIKNGTSGQVLKIDVLVMEHLFYNQKITRTFDLKGIQDRHAGSKVSTNNRGNGNGGGGGSTTLWDGDFIEGRYKALLLIHSHSKKIIREALVNDTEFLSGANIMDYSLLVGVDDERKELVVGIVDFIGAYTWYKRIESKGKTTLRGAKDSVTVLPPQQYMTRFQQSMEQYFIAVPDKWSKTVVEQKREAKKEIRANIPSTIPEGSKESTDINTPDLEQSLKSKTSGYLEKMSKAFVLQSSSAKLHQADTLSTSPASPAGLATPAPTFRKKGTKTVEGSKLDSGVLSEASQLRYHTTDAEDEALDQRERGLRLPRVFYPLD